MHPELRMKIEKPRFKGSGTDMLEPHRAKLWRNRTSPRCKESSTRSGKPNLAKLLANKKKPKKTLSATESKKTGSEHDRPGMNKLKSGHAIDLIEGEKSKCKRSKVKSRNPGFARLCANVGDSRIA